MGDLFKKGASSRKYVMACIGIALTVLNRKLGLDLSPEDMLAINGLIGVYILGQGAVDAADKLKKKEGA